MKRLFSSLIKLIYSSLEYFGGAMYGGRAVRRVYLTGCTKALVVALQVTDSSESNRKKMHAHLASECAPCNTHPPSIVLRVSANS